MKRLKCITEDALRCELRATEPECYVVPEGKILTPAAEEGRRKIYQLTPRGKELLDGEVRRLRMLLADAERIEKEARQDENG